MNSLIKKKTFIVVCGVIAALFIFLVIFVLSFDINSYKPRIEAAISQATGLQVSVKGKMGLSFFPFGAYAGDIRLSTKGVEIASIERLNIGIELIPLLNKRINVTICEVVRPVVTIDQAPIGIIGAETPTNKSSKDKKIGSFNLNELRVKAGRLIYLEKKAGIKSELNDFNATLKGISIEDTSADIIRTVSFSGYLEAATFIRQNFKISNLKSEVRGERGVFTFKPVRMDLFDAKAEGFILIDKSGDDAVYKMNFNIPKLDLARLQEAFETKKIIGGKADIETSVVINNKGGRKLSDGLEGTFLLRGENLIMYGVDIDKTLTSYSRTQNFNLVDLGSFLVAGPIGIIASKGYYYGDVYSQSRGGQTSIRRLVSRWNLRKGKADCADCAFSTQNNRVAMKGRLNLVDERYEGVTVAILDERGCAKIKQSVSGPFGKPKFGSVSAAETLASPIINLYRKVKKVVGGSKCEVFYNGEVRHPI